MKKIHKIFYLALFSFLIVHCTLKIEDCLCQWSSDVKLTNATDTSITGSYNPKAIASNGDFVYVVWSDKRNGNFDIFFKRSINGGINWENDIQLTNNAEKQSNPAIAISGSIVHIAWADARISGVASEIFYKHSTDKGLTWSTETRLTFHNPVPPPGLIFGTFPAITVADSLVNIYWHDNRDGSNAQIYYKNSSDGGIGWGTDKRLTFTDKACFFPSCTVSGPVYNLFWDDYRDNCYRIFHKQSTDYGITWGPDMQLSYYPLTQYGYNHSSASGLLLYVVWNDVRDGNMEIYGKRSTDGGITWASDLRLTFNPSFSGNPSVSVSGNYIHVVWHDNRDGGYEIYYKRSTDGGITWESDIRLTEDTNISRVASVSVSGSTVHVLWNDDRNGNFEIYYKRNPTGNPIGIVNINTETPEEFKLEQNYPNPFNPVTKIKFSLKEEGRLKMQDVKLIIYDILGKEIATLVNESLNPGTYEVTFDGSQLTSGVYFYKLTTGDFIETKKMVLLK